MTRDPWHRRLLGWLIHLAVRLLGKTVRCRQLGFEAVDALLRGGHRVVYAFWHGRQFMMLAPHAGERAVIMVSLSRDGTLQREVVEGYGFATVRGSSSRRGREALSEMESLIRGEGYRGGLAVDGPRGPRERAKPGAVELAARVGGWIVPVSAAARRCWSLRSWDRLMIPWPFTRGVVSYGEPFRVEDSRRGRADGLAALQRGLDEATLRAEEQLT